MQSGRKFSAELWEAWEESKSCKLPWLLPYPLGEAQPPPETLPEAIYAHKRTTRSRGGSTHTHNGALRKAMEGWLQSWGGIVIFIPPLPIFVLHLSPSLSTRLPQVRRRLLRACGALERTNEGSFFFIDIRERLWTSRGAVTWLLGLCLIAGKSIMFFSLFCTWFCLPQSGDVPLWPWLRGSLSHDWKELSWKFRPDVQGWILRSWWCFIGMHHPQ